jgi:uncharacterized protein (TIGR00255 family)
MCIFESKLVDMLRSMTGYGKAEMLHKNRKLSVEIRSLNSKQLDLNVRIPQIYREKELEIRSIYGEKITRGKCEISIFFEQQSSEQTTQLNTELLDLYYTKINTWKEGKDLGQADVLSALLRMPEVFKPELQEASKEEWDEFEKLMSDAFQQFDNYRNTEGAKLKEEFHTRIKNILKNRDVLIAPLEDRIKKTREKIKGHLQDIIGTEKIDENRFEQELIYYIEKLDVSEEIQRLLSNCEMFLEELNGPAQGRKLGFISQEIGREINTIGSKANDSIMQRIVVDMKDELEKIKEQINNVL